MHFLEWSEANTPFFSQNVAYAPLLLHILDPPLHGCNNVGRPNKFINHLNTQFKVHIYNNICSNSIYNTENASLEGITYNFACTVSGYISSNINGSID